MRFLPFFFSVKPFLSVTAHSPRAMLSFSPVEWRLESSFFFFPNLGIFVLFFSSSFFWRAFSSPQFIDFFLTRARFFRGVSIQLANATRPYVGMGGHVVTLSFPRRVTAHTSPAPFPSLVPKLSYANAFGMFSLLGFNESAFLGFNLFVPFSFLPCNPFSPVKLTSLTIHSFLTDITANINFLRWSSTRIFSPYEFSRFVDRPACLLFPFSPSTVF